MRAFIAILILSQTSCYSFRGISIDPEIDYFFVETFEDVSGAIPPGYNEIFTETFVQKILNDTRLDVSEPKGEIIFSGKFTQFLVRAEDPGENTETNLNRLYLTITVEYYNQKTDESWTKKYEERQDFGGDVNFADVEDELLEIVAERIIERIFIDAFTNW